MTSSGPQLTRDDVVRRTDFRRAYAEYLPDLRPHSKTQAMARCRFHDDRKPSLSINLVDGRWFCHACREGGDLFQFVQRVEGCDFREALGLVAARNGMGASARQVPVRIAASYDYTDEQGRVLFQVLRSDPKGFRQRRPDGQGGWIWNLDGVRRVLYRLPEVIATVQARGAVYLVEGEKDVESLLAWDGADGLSIAATCSPGGAGGRHDCYGPLAGGHVVIVVDKDEPGRRFAAYCFSKIRDIASSIRVVEPAAGKDLTDHLQAGLGLEDLVDVTAKYAAAEDPEVTFEFPPAIDLFDASVKPETPAFAVENLVRRRGLHMIWAPPSGGKTYLMLWLVISMLRRALPSTLFGHPDLAINSGWSRVEWIATEENAGALRYRADAVCRGMGVERPDGLLMHRFALSGQGRLTIEDAPRIAEIDGPLDAIVFDSLTGLRPRTIEGRTIAWDRDNEAANDMCLRLRDLAESRDVACFIVHHTGRDVAKGYRGPTDWWASADVQFGLVPEEHRLKIVVEKNRDGRVVQPFFLEREWSEGAFTLRHGGAAEPALAPSVAKVLEFGRSSGRVSQAAIVSETGIARSTVQLALGHLVKTGFCQKTDSTVAGSPVYVFAEVQ